MNNEPVINNNFKDTGIDSAITFFRKKLLLDEQSYLRSLFWITNDQREREPLIALLFVGGIASLVGFILTLIFTLQK